MKQKIAWKLRKYDIIKDVNTFLLDEELTRGNEGDILYLPKMAFEWLQKALVDLKYSEIFPENIDK